MSKQIQASQSVLSLPDLWKKVRVDDDRAPNQFKWMFLTMDEATRHLKLYERSLKTIGAMHGVEEILIQCQTGEEWSLRPRRVRGVEINFLPMLPHGPVEANRKFLVTHEGIIPGGLVDLLAEIKNSDSVRAIVDWRTQKQVVMNAACEAHPIGTDLQECLNYSRHDYFDAPDLEDLFVKCRQRDRVEHSYWTFDPVNLADGGDGDRMRLHARYEMIDCGTFGLYQTGIVERIE